MFPSLRSLTLVALFCTVIASGLCYAQSTYCSDPGATPVDTLSVVNAPVSGGTPVEMKLKNTSQSWEVLVLKTSTGVSSLSIPVESIGISGLGADSVDDITTAELMQLIDQVSVQRALVTRAITMPEPGGWKSVNVYHAGCVTRTGSGATTEFHTALNGCCIKTFVISTPAAGGVPTITMISANGPSCDSPLQQSTWNDSTSALSTILQ